MTLLPFFEWCEATFIGDFIRTSLWLFPFIEAVHLVAFAVLGGTILMVDLRLVGVAFRSQPVALLAKEARRWQNGSLAVAVVTGILLFLSESLKLYYNEPFWIKITCLFLALIFTFTVRRKVVDADPARVWPLLGRLVGLISIGLWGGVAWGGRWIGFWG